MFDPMKSLERHLNEVDLNSRIPRYNDSSDYTTNAPSYYDDLARKNKLIKHLALRIWDYDEELKKRFEAWDKNLEEFDDEVLRLLKEWMEDGTFDEIINEVIFNDLNNKVNENIQDIEDINKSIDELFTSVSENGAVGDGVTDDTKAIQDTIDKNTGIYLPGDRVYNITQIKVPDGKHLKIGQNVKIISDFVLNDAMQGHIHVEGKLTGNNYMVNKDIKPMDSEITLVNVPGDYFKKGDTIELTQTRKYELDSQVETDEEHRQQHGYCVLTVKSFKNGVIQTYETIPYELKTAYGARVQKVLPAENVVIEGDNTEFDLQGMTTHGNFINVKYGVNTKISGFNFINGAGKGVQIINSNRFNINDVSYGSPTDKTSAKGEAILISKSGNGTINNVYVYESRRGIDFANAWFCTVNDCFMNHARLTTHGLLSKYITFNNCIVQGPPYEEDISFTALTFGSITYKFDEFIKINNCKIYGGFNGCQIVDGSNEITIINSEFHRNNMPIAVNRGAHTVTLQDIKFRDNRNTATFQEGYNVTIKNWDIYERRNVDNASIYLNDSFTDIFIDGIKADYDREVLFYINLQGTLIEDSKVVIQNSQFKNVQENAFLYVGAVKGLKLFNIQTNNRLRLTGKTNIFVTNSEFKEWNLVDNLPTKNFIIKNNTLTGISARPIQPLDNLENNILVADNIYIGG